MNGLVYLNGKAGPSGLTVNLSSKNTTVANVPATVKANAQVSAVAFTTTTHGVDSNTDVQINAWLDPSAAISTMLKVKQPDMQKINLLSSVAWPGGEVYGYAWLLGEAGPSGVMVHMSTDNPSLLTLSPSDIFLSYGIIAGNFSGRPGNVTKDTVVVITAKLDNGSKVSTSVTIKAGAPPKAVKR